MHNRLAALLALTLATVIVLPPAGGGLLPGVAVALADDDDGGDDDGGGSGSGGGGRGDGAGRSYRGDGGNFLRSLFGGPKRETRRAPARRAVAVPDRAESEIVATGLDADAIAGLEQEGFVVGSRVQVALLGGEMVRLIAPRGMALDAARAAVVARSASATVDFNHFYQPEAGKAGACAREGCTLVRHMVGWPADGGAGGALCLKPQRIGLIDTAINAGHSVLENARLEVVHLGEAGGTASGEQHGTAVAALLVGTPESRVPGLLPGSELVAVDAFRRLRASADVASVYDLVRALDLLVGREIKVINLSLSGPANAILERSVAVAVDKGTILVAAAGNDGPNARPVYPAAYDDVIAVTAVDKAGRPYRRAVRGDHIDIAAPGVGVWTAASVSGARQKTGTSFAAPFVTAAAAALLSAKPGLSPAAVEAELMRSAEDMGKPGKDAVYGWGLLNARMLCREG